MPMYEYECTACGKRFDITLSITEHEKLHDSPPRCPACKSAMTRQLMSSFYCKVSSGDA